MGDVALFDWWKRRSQKQKARQPAKLETVQFFDFELQRVVEIPHRELSPGAVRARIDGIEGIVWVLPDQLTAGPHQHPPFDEAIRDYIRDIQTAFAEHRDLTVEEWEDGFRRDTNPGREIGLWSHAADVYRAFADAEPSADRRFDIYRCIVACLTASPDTVWHILEPETLSREEAEQVVNQFYGKGSSES